MADLSQADLVACLSAIPPVTLLGVELLRQLRPTTGAWFPAVSRDVMQQATQEMIVYSKDCLSLMHRLSALPAVPLYMIIPEACL